MHTMLVNKVSVCVWGGGFGCTHIVFKGVGRRGYFCQRETQKQNK